MVGWLFKIPQLSIPYYANPPYNLLNLHRQVHKKNLIYGIRRVCICVQAN